MNEQLPSLHICLVHPDGYLHGDALLDPALYVHYQLQRFGGEVTFDKNRLRHGAVNLVFGAHSGFDPVLSQYYSCVIVNLEQIGAGGAALPPNYLNLLRHLPVIDYDAANPPNYTEYPQDVPVIPFLHARYLDSDAVLPLAQRPIDLLFFGSMNERRRKLLQRIQACGRKVVVAPAPLYGEERDELIRQAKAVVNVPFYESARFEQVRAFLCMSLGTPVISELHGASQPPPVYRDCVTWFSDDSLEQVFGAEYESAAFEAHLQAQLQRFREHDPVEQYADAMAFAAGIWQVHQQGPIGQVNEDLLLDFSGKAAAAAAAAAAAPVQRDALRPAPLFQYPDAAVAQVEQLIGAGRHDEALNRMALTVHQQFCLKDVAHHALNYPDFDRQIEKLARQPGLRAAKPSKAAAPLGKATLFVVTEVYQVGGHTKVLEDLARQVERPVILLTDAFTTYQGGKALPAWIAEQFAGMELHCLPDAPAWLKCQALARLTDELAPANIVYLQHHQDPLAFVGTLGHAGSRKTLIHHGDHNPSLGCTLAGVLHADLTEMLRQTCASHLQQPVHLLPLHVPDQGRQPAPADAARALSVVTSGRHGKFTHSGALALHRIVAAALQAIDGVFYFVGPMDEGWLALIQSQLRAQQIDPQRFVPLGLVPSLWQCLLSLDAAVYIGSAPVGGGRAAIEAQGAGLPVLFFAGGGNGSLIENFSVYADTRLGWEDPEALARQLRALAPSVGELGEQARRYYEENFSLQHFRGKLAELLGEDALR